MTENQESSCTDEQADTVRDIMSDMLRDEVDDMVVVDGDDWDGMNRFDTGDRVYLRCSFYIPDGRDDYVWVVQDQTSVELDITDSPTPDKGATAVVECDVGDRVNGESVRLISPKVVDLKVAAKTIDELAERVFE